MYARASASTWTPWFYETLASDELKTAALEALDPFGACQTLCSVGVADGARGGRAAVRRDGPRWRASARCTALPPPSARLVEQWAGSEGWHDNILTPAWHMLVIGAHMLSLRAAVLRGCCGSNRRCPAFLCVNKWRFEFAAAFRPARPRCARSNVHRGVPRQQGFVRCCRCFAPCCGDGLAPLKLWQKLACSWCAMVNYEGQTWRCRVVFVCDFICCLFARWYTAFAWEPRLAANSYT